MIDFECPNCGRALKVRDEFAGRKAKCPRCQANFTVPEKQDLHIGAEPPKDDTPPLEDIARLAPQSAPYEATGGPPFPRERRMKKSGSGFEDFMSFRVMITPWLVERFFWLGVLGCVILGVGMLADDSRGYGSGILGLLVMIGGPFVLRIWCEWMILFFRMYETMQEIERNQKK